MNGKRKRADDVSGGAEAAARDFHAQGYAVVENAMPAAWIAAARRRIDTLGVRLQYGGLRAELNFATDDGPFASPDLIQNARLSPILDRLLSKRRKIQRIGGIISFPGSDDQQIHRVIPVISLKLCVCTHLD
jgi:hypothetical protein